MTYSYIGSEKAIADLPIFNGNVSPSVSHSHRIIAHIISSVFFSWLAEAWRLTSSGEVHTSALCFH